MGRPVAELLGGTPPVCAEISGPSLRLVLISGVAVLAATFVAPVTFAPVIAAGWLAFLASRVRLQLSGGGTPPISSRELTEWMAYNELEPFGEWRADLRMGILASLFANAHRDPKKRPKPYEPDDFIPKFDAEPKQPRSWQDQLAFIEMWNAALGGEDKRMRR